MHLRPTQTRWFETYVPSEERLIVNHGCEPVGLPAWLPDQRGERERVLQAHLAQNTQEIAELERELATLRADPKIAEARANVETLGWYLEHATADITERRPAHITGWTTAEDMDNLQRVPLFLAAPGTKLSSLPTALGELLMSAFELAMNTLSFVRVGAFALGHAALSHALLALTLSVENPIAWIVIVVAGNLFSIVLESLLVFVQTTRLVLFEFFVRFLQAEGRLFRPLT